MTALLLKVGLVWRKGCEYPATDLAVGADSTSRRWAGPTTMWLTAGPGSSPRGFRGSDERPPRPGGRGGTATGRLDATSMAWHSPWTKGKGGLETKPARCRVE